MLQALQLAGGGSAFGGSDLVYGGNGSKWRKLAESMRLRLAMRIRYTDPATSKTQAEKAYNSGALITSNDDNAFIATSSDNRNPLETITDWGEFRMSATMEGIFKGFDDPRRMKYFDPAKMVIKMVTVILMKVYKMGKLRLHLVLVKIH